MEAEIAKGKGRKAMDSAGSVENDPMAEGHQAKKHPEKVSSPSKTVLVFSHLANAA